MNRTTVLTLIALTFLGGCGDAPERIPRLDFDAAFGWCKHVDTPQAFFEFFGAEDAVASGAEVGQGEISVHVTYPPC